MNGIFSGISLLGFFSIFVLYIQRVYFSQSILVIPEAREWTQLQQGYLQGSFFFGYLIIQLLVGPICSLVGGRTLSALSMCLAAVSYILIPFIVGKAPFSILVLIRTIMGASQGALYPGLLAVLGTEIPVEFKSSVVNFVFSGGQAGSIFIYLFSPILFAALSVFLNSLKLTEVETWQVQFTILGLSGLIIFLLWIIYSSIKKRNVNVKFPSKPSSKEKEQEMSWLFLFSQKAFWSYIGASLSYNWFMMVIISFLPKLLRFMLHFGTDQQQILSAIPFTGFWIFTVLTGIFADHFVSKGYALILVRRYSGLLGYLACAFLLFIMGIVFTEASALNNRVTIFILLTAIITTSGISKSSFGPNGLDLARSPVNIAKITGAAFFGVSIVGIISPMMASWLFHLGGCTDSLSEPSSCYFVWRLIFVISAAINILAAIIWGFWVSVSPISRL